MLNELYCKKAMTYQQVINSSGIGFNFLNNIFNLIFLNEKSD